MRDITFLFFKAWCKKVGLKPSSPQAVSMYLATKGGQHGKDL